MIRFEKFKLYSLNENKKLFFLRLSKWYIAKSESESPLLLKKNKIYNYIFSKGDVNKSRGKLVEFWTLINKNKVKIICRRDNSDFEVFEQIFINEEYLNVKDLLVSLNIKPSIIIDAGANIGLTTLYLNGFFDDCNFICIEPNNQNIDLLKKNIAANNIGCSIIEKGIWGSKTQLRINGNFRDKKAWSFSLTENKDETSDKIDCVTFEDIIKEYNLLYIDFLKIDIEGAEWNVFKNPNLEWLKLVKVIAIEIHEEFGDKVFISDILVFNSFNVYFSGELIIGYK